MSVSYRDPHDLDGGADCGLWGASRLGDLAASQHLITRHDAVADNDRGIDGIAWMAARRIPATKAKAPASCEIGACLDKEPSSVLLSRG